MWSLPVFAMSPSGRDRPVFRRWCLTAQIDAAVQALNGVDVLVVVPPGFTGSMEDRYRFGAALGLIVSRARHHTLKHVVVLSVPGTQYELITFARQFLAIERAIEASGVPFTVLALQMFAESLFGWADGIKQGRLYMQLSGKGRKAFSPLTVQDIADAAAAVARHPSAHAGKRYTLTGPQQLSADEIAAEFSAVLGKPIAHVQVDGNGAKQAMAGKVPAWYAEGIVELFNLAEQHPEYMGVTGDLEQLVQRKPTLLRQWIEQHKAAFV